MRFSLVSPDQAKPKYASSSRGNHNQYNIFSLRGMALGTTMYIPHDIVRDMLIASLLALVGDET